MVSLAGFADCADKLVQATFPTQSTIRIYTRSIEAEHKSILSMCAKELIHDDFDS